MDAAVDEAHPWTEPFDVILRWRRFVLLGTAALWTAVAIGAFLWPRTVVCEATLTLPNISYADEKPPNSAAERPRKPGIPVGIYKKLEASLADSALLTGAFKEKLSEREIRRLQQNLRRVASPLTSGARDEITRTEREDTVTGVRLSYSDFSPERAVMVVSTVATLVRDELGALVAQDRIEVYVLQATTAARAALTRKLDLAARNESLQGLASDLKKLSSVSPSSIDSRREVVDVNEGGHRYLPPVVQLIGAKALEADNSHEIRLADWDFRVESLRVAFFRRLDAKVRQSRQPRESTLQDLPTLIDSEVQAFLSKHSSPEANYLRAEVEGLRDVLQSHLVTTAFVQRPSVRTVPRAPWIIAAVVASLVVVLLTALVGESWRRYHSLASARA